MNDPPIKTPVDDGYERQLREINEALLISSVRQHELTEQARKIEQALRQSEENLARELAATQHLQEISTRMIQEGYPGPLYEQIMDAAMAVMAPKWPAFKPWTRARARYGCWPFGASVPSSARFLR